MEPNKKLIAVASAVMHYIKTEEEIVCIQAAENRLQPVAQPVVVTPKYWAISGRLDMMNTRAMMQMKAFRR